MIGFFRMVFYAIAAYLVYKFVKFVLAPLAGSQTRPRAEGRSGVMVKDEVCNTYLPREDAIKETIGGVDQYFCSEACRAKYLAGRKSGAESAGRPSP
jgi:uncharacterized protein